MKKRLLALLAAAAMLLGTTVFASGEPSKEAISSVEPTASAEAAASTEAAASGEIDYAGALFDTGYIHEINITISDEDWDYILANAIDKPKVKVTATIDGEVYEDVRFSTKGNVNLFLVAADSESDRYGFKLKFDDDQLYHGLDQLVLNNSFGDSSYLRDYAAAYLFSQAGVPTSLMSFTKLYINGELFGVYIAAEVQKDSFLDRAFDGDGALYKPVSEVLDTNVDGMISRVREAMENGTTDDFFANISANMPFLPAQYNTPGADLVYTDNDPDSYSDILDNAVTDTDDDLEEALIKALKNLSEGNYDKAIDTDEVVRYFAVNNFICNPDNYNNVQLHNYVLHESNDGILSMVPWDYNSCMKPGRWAVTGGTDNTSWTELINMGIDSPTYSEVALEDRPMLSWIYEDADAYAEYEEILHQIIACIDSGEFEAEMQRMYEQIRPYVAEDPTAFCTLEEFDESYQDIINFCTLRAQSVTMQLNGDLARITADQDPAARLPYKE